VTSSDLGALAPGNQLGTGRLDLSGDC
jgi:hypothetical protein